MLDISFDLYPNSQNCYNITMTINNQPDILYGPEGPVNYQTNDKFLPLFNDTEDKIIIVLCNTIELRLTDPERPDYIMIFPKGNRSNTSETISRSALTKEKAIEAIERCQRAVKKYNELYFKPAPEIALIESLYE